jgi:aldehyde dehydrogenase (NAD+)
MEEKNITPEKNAAALFEKLKVNEINLRKKSIAERKQKLKLLLHTIERHSEKIEQAVYQDFRKSSSEVKLTEIFTVTSEIKHVLRNLNAWAQPIKVPAPITLFGSSNKIIYQPKGIVLIISPWNYPFQLAVGPLVTAFAAGNGVVIKPSEISPNTSEVIAKIISEVFDPDEVTVVQGGKDVAEALLELPFDHIFYTGSGTVGKIVMRKAADNLTGVTLELGGKSPVVIDKTADIKNAATKIAWGKFLNAGQTCIAPDYVLVPEAIENELVKSLKSAIFKMYGDFDEIKTNGDYCRIINSRQFLQLKFMIDDAVKNGAEIKCGGEFDENENFISPTVLTSVNVDSEIMKTEIFGPVLPVISYNKIEEVFDIIGRNQYPLSLYIFSKEKKFADEIITRVPSGGVSINDVVVHFANYNLPFGGIKSSGFGNGHGYFGFKTFSHARAVMKQPKFTTTRMFYPPFTGRVKKMIDFVIKYF